MHKMSLELKLSSSNNRGKIHNLYNMPNVYTPLAINNGKIYFNSSSIIFCYSTKLSLVVKK